MSLRMFRGTFCRISRILSQNQERIDAQSANQTAFLLEYNSSRVHCCITVEELLLKNRTLGNAGLSVSILGLGTGNIGDPVMSEQEVSRLLNAAVDLGITLFDTARSYGLSEQRIGEHLASRRKELVLSTKVGYGIPGYADWTGPCIEAGVDAALKRLKTDWIDIVHLHSCPVSVLAKEEIIAALESAVSKGKARVAAYSGDNEPLDWAVASDRFGSIQTSINICDQRELERTVPQASRKGMGVIAKRSLANSPWRYKEGPSRDQAAQAYWDRWQKMELQQSFEEPGEIALRFVASLPEVSSCLVGTRTLEHLKANVNAINKGPLSQEIVAKIRSSFQKHGHDWISQI